MGDALPGACLTVTNFEISGFGGDRFIHSSEMVRTLDIAPLRETPLQKR